jgi:hypothetical protein
LPAFKIPGPMCHVKDGVQMGTGYLCPLVFFVSFVVRLA